MKKPLAWAPVMKPSLGPTPVNCSMCRIRSWGRISHGSMLGLTGAWGWDLKQSRSCLILSVACQCLVDS